jgi:hypothetical protein
LERQRVASAPQLKRTASGVRSVESCGVGASRSSNWREREVGRLGFHVKTPA